MGDEQNPSPVTKAIAAQKKRREELILEYKKKQASLQAAAISAPKKCGTCGQKRRVR